MRVTNPPPNAPRNLEMPPGGWLVGAEVYLTTGGIAVLTCNSKYEGKVETPVWDVYYIG